MKKIVIPRLPIPTSVPPEWRSNERLVSLLLLSRSAFSFFFSQSIFTSFSVRLSFSFLRLSFLLSVSVTPSPFSVRLQRHSDSARVRSHFGAASTESPAGFFFVVRDANTPAAAAGSSSSNGSSSIRRAPVEMILSAFRYLRYASAVAVGTRRRRQSNVDLGRAGRRAKRCRYCRRRYAESPAASVTITT